MIFRILGKIAMPTRFFDRIDDRRAFEGLEMTHFGLQLFIAFGQHRHLVDGRHNLAFRKKFVAALS